MNNASSPSDAMTVLLNDCMRLATMELGIYRRDSFGLRHQQV
jgi:hypothetical protein